MTVLFCQNKEYRDWVWVWDASTPEKKQQAISDMWTEIKKSDYMTFPNDFTNTIEKYQEELERLQKLQGDFEAGKIPDYYIENAKQELRTLSTKERQLRDMDFDRKICEKAHQGNIRAMWDYMNDHSREFYEFDFVEVINS